MAPRNRQDNPPPLLLTLRTMVTVSERLFENHLYVKEVTEI